jgi:hypothetical protein
MTMKDNQSLVSAKYKGSDTEIQTYDDGFGPLWISRNSIGINGIVRARTWEDAYSICEDEFFPEADETVDELVKEYGFKREHVKVIKSDVSIPESERPSYLGAYEKVAELSDYSDNGKLPDGLFLRWETVETPDPDAWIENELFQDLYGLRNNGPNDRDKLNHGIYRKDLNGDYLDRLTDELLERLNIELVITSDDDDEGCDECMTYPCSCDDEGEIA